MVLVFSKIRRFCQLQWLTLVVLLVLAVAATALDLWQLQQRFGIFTGGTFLQPYSFLTFSSRASLIGLLWWVEITALVIAYTVILLCVRLQPTRRTLAWFVVWILLWRGGSSLVGAQIQQFFGGNLDWQVLQNLGGGDAWAAIAMVGQEVRAQLVPLLLAIGGAVLAAVAIHRGLRRFTTPLPNCRGWFVGLALLLLLMPVQLTVTASKPSWFFALNKTQPQQWLAEFYNQLTDLDRDGYGAFGSDADRHPLDSARFPGAMDLPANGIDEDELAGDLPALPQSLDPLATAEPQQKPHIFLVVLESVRADSLHKEWQGQAVMPNLKQLAASGSAHPQAFSHTGFTTSSLKAMFNRSLSQHPPQQGLLRLLKQQGYQLNVLSAQAEQFGDVATATGMTELADYFFDASKAPQDNMSADNSPGAMHLSENRLLVQLQQRFAEINWQQPQFVYINIQAAHYPYVHRETKPLLTNDFIARSEMTIEHRDKLQASYYNAVANTDWLIGQLQQTLAQYQIDARNSVQLYTSDHGESLFDDGVLGHGHQLSDTQTQVVWVSNRALQQPAIIGHDRVAEVLLRNAWQLPDLLPEQPVLQVIGLVRLPQQIALVDGAGRVSYDFRSKLVRTAHGVLPYAELAAGATPAEQARVDLLFTRWGWLRYQQSTVYQQKLQSGLGAASAQ